MSTISAPNRLCHYHRGTNSWITTQTNNQSSFKSNYLKYRQKIVALYQSKGHEEIAFDNTRVQQNNVAAFEAAERAVVLLAQKSRTWKRLSHIVELSTIYPRRKEYRSICDIGCDHGLLSISLASTRRFQKVIGVDVSDVALENGAKRFHRKAMDALVGSYGDGNDIQQGIERLCESSLEQILPVEYRFGDGLYPLKPGEADAICMAGLGVDTIVSILQTMDTCTGTNNHVRYLDFLQCQSLFLQPPNARPRKLVELYETVHNLGFSLVNERIIKLKERYYITSHFDRDACQNEQSSSDARQMIPGSFLVQSPDAEQRKLHREFVEHHLQWLQNDFKKHGDLAYYDKLWIDNNSRWNTICITDAFMD
jgi:tRNA A22 N-methylase